MGKQGHRKRQQKKKGPTTGKPSTKKTSSSSSSSGSLILQRLRHADPRTRHAALAALSTTVLDPDTLASPHTSSAAQASTSFLSISTDVLQAIRERVMDDDLECAQAAAGCLNNYVSFCPTPKQEICAGWTVLLVGRLQQCRDILFVQQHQQASTTTTAVQPPKLKLIPLQQWTALTVQCLQTLCALIENNPLAVERIQQQYSSSSSSEVLQVLLDLLSMAITHQFQPANEGMVDSNENGVDNKAMASVNKKNLQKLQQQQDADASITTMQRTIAIYAARTLHSALDDNSELLLPWLLSSTSVHNNAKAGIQLLQQCCAVTVIDLIQTPPPAAAQLHCAGCLVTARQQVIMELASPAKKPHQTQIMVLQNWADVLQDVVLVSVVPLLHRHLQSFDPVQSRTLLVHYVEAAAAYKQEMEDSQLERDVIRDVEQRHEPARSIARRQKALKEQQGKGKVGDVVVEKGDEEDDENVEKMQDTDDDTSPKENKVKSNRRDAMEDARQALHASFVPLQLALEITTNLTTPSSTGDDDDDAMDDDEDCDEQESSPVLLADQQLMTGLVERSIPDCVLTLLQHVCQLPANDSNDQRRVPEDAVEEITNLIPKCAACLGNCMANLKWQNIPASMWTTLQQCMMLAASSNMIQDSTDAIDGLWTAMVVAVKSQDVIRKHVRHEDVEWLLTQLSSQSQQRRPSAVGQREIVAILGVWCREELHPSELNHKVCQALVSLLISADSSPLMVTSEVLNALMDMYGNDDHGEVFDKLNVMGHLQRTLPIFQRRLQQQTEEDTDTLDLWSETVMNVQRFILYKKSS